MSVQGSSHLRWNQAREFARENKKEVKRFAKFAIVGTAGAVMHYTILNLLVQLAHWSTTISNPFGFVAAVSQNFILNRRWTFPESRERNVIQQLGQFFAVNLVGLGINQLVFAQVHHRLEPLWASLIHDSHLAYTASYNFALAIAIAIVLIWNFTVNRLWTYRGL